MKKMYYLGFDIGGTKCAVIIGGTDGIPREKIKFPTSLTFTETWNDLVSHARKLLAGTGISASELISAGISCGGPLDSKTGFVLSPPNLPGWDRIPITEMTSKEFGIPAFLMNDANACALAEWKYGAGRGIRNMVFLTMGTGLGGGIVLDGRLYEGPSGMAGEFGHIRLRPSGPVGYGKAGSFEGFCGGAGIARHAAMLAETDEYRESAAEYRRIADDFSVRSLDIAQAKGSVFAKKMFEITGEMLGYGLAVIIDGLNPERVVIGSIFERSENLLRPSMERILKQEVLPASLDACQVVPAQLGDRIGDYAALTVARYGIRGDF